MLFLAKEFTEIGWYPHFRKVKKLLRKKSIPFTIKKQPTRDGLIHSIWANEEHIDAVRREITGYYGDDPKTQRQAERVEELSSEFEKNWFYYLLAIIYHYGRYRPLLFWPLFLVIVAAFVAPIFWYV